MNVKLGITMLALLGASACGSKPNDEPTAHAPLFVCAGPDPAPVLVLEIDEGYFAAVDDRYVYVKDDESIARYPLTGGQRESLSKREQAHALSGARDESSLYTIRNGDIHRVDLASGHDEVFVKETPGYAYGLLGVDAGTLVFTRSTPPKTLNDVWGPNILMKKSPGGNAVSLGDDVTFGAIVHEGYVYDADATGIFRISIATGIGVHWVDSPTVGTQSMVAFAGDSGGLVIGSNGWSGPSGGETYFGDVWRLDSESKSVQVIASSQPFAYDVAVGPAHVAWEVHPDDWEDPSFANLPLEERPRVLAAPKTGGSAIPIGLGDHIHLVHVIDRAVFLMNDSGQELYRRCL